jgi:hypothetical protein
MRDAPADTIGKIAAAFEHRVLAQDDAVFMSESSEVDTAAFRQMARTTKWHDIPHSVVIGNPMALAIATPAAFAWLLPAYMVVSVAMHAQTDVLTAGILSCLTPPDEVDDDLFRQLHQETRAIDPELADDLPPDDFGADEELSRIFMDRAEKLTPPEKRAVRDYLEYIEAAHGADFPAFGPRQALSRYWGRQAPAGGAKP